MEDLGLLTAACERTTTPFHVATGRGPGPYRAPGGEVTRLLHAWGAGDADAAERLVPLIYGELRKIAAGLLATERPGHPLQPTALINEAYLRMVRQRSVRWENRSHFFGITARMMRRILVDQARRAAASRRGGAEAHEPLSDASDLGEERPDRLVELDSALDRLQRIDPRQAEIVEYRFFAGFTGAEIAEVLGISTATVQRRWRLARAWLYRELTDAPSVPNDRG